MLEDYPIIYHITWNIHCSRVSERMILYKVKSEQAIWLDEYWRLEIAKYLVSIINVDKLIILALNVLSDHVHIILVCKSKDRDNIVRKLKGKSSQMYKQAIGLKTLGFHLWNQKYGRIIIANEERLFAAIEYIENNHLKHGLPESVKFRCLVKDVVSPYYSLYL